MGLWEDFIDGVGRALGYSNQTIVSTEVTSINLLSKSKEDKVKNLILSSIINDIKIEDNLLFGLSRGLHVDYRFYLKEGENNYSYGLPPANLIDTTTEEATLINATISDAAIYNYPNSTNIVLDSTKPNLNTQIGTVGIEYYLGFAELHKKIGNDLSYQYTSDPTKIEEIATGNIINLVDLPTSKKIYNGLDSSGNPIYVNSYREALPTYLPAFTTFYHNTDEILCDVFTLDTTIRTGIKYGTSTFGLTISNYDTYTETTDTGSYDSTLGSISKKLYLSYKYDVVEDNIIDITYTELSRANCVLDSNGNPTDVCDYTYTKTITVTPTTVTKYPENKALANDLDVRVYTEQGSVTQSTFPTDQLGIVDQWSYTKYFTLDLNSKTIENSTYITIQGLADSTGVLLVSDYTIPFQDSNWLTLLNSKYLPIAHLRELSTDRDTDAELKALLNPLDLDPVELLNQLKSNANYDQMVSIFAMFGISLFDANLNQSSLEYLYNYFDSLYSNQTYATSSSNSSIPDKQVFIQNSQFNCCLTYSEILKEYDIKAVLEDVTIEDVNNGLAVEVKRAIYEITDFTIEYKSWIQMGLMASSGTFSYSSDVDKYAAFSSVSANNTVAYQVDKADGSWTYDTTNSGTWSYLDSNSLAANEDFYYFKIIKNDLSQSQYTDKCTAANSGKFYYLYSLSVSYSVSYQAAPLYSSDMLAANYQQCQAADGTYYYVDVYNHDSEIQYVTNTLNVYSYGVNLLDPKIKESNIYTGYYYNVDNPDLLFKYIKESLYKTESGNTSDYPEIISNIGFTTDREVYASNNNNRVIFGGLIQEEYDIFDFVKSVREARLDSNISYQYTPNSLYNTTPYTYVVDPTDTTYNSLGHLYYGEKREIDLTQIRQDIENSTINNTYSISISGSTVEIRKKTDKGDAVLYINKSKLTYDIQVDSNNNRNTKVFDTATTNNTNAILPIDEAFLKTLNPFKQDYILQDSLKLVVFSGSVTELEWYQTEPFISDFKVFMDVVAIATIIVTFGTATSVVSALYTLAIEALIAASFSWAVDEILKSDVDENTKKVLVIALAVAYAYRPGTSLSAFINKLGQAATTITSIDIKQLQDKVNKIKEDTLAEIDTLSKKKEELDAKAEELFTSNLNLLYLSSVKIENPSDFLDRTLRVNWNELTLKPDTALNVVLPRLQETISKIIQDNTDRYKILEYLPA